MASRTWVVHFLLLAGLLVISGCGEKQSAQSDESLRDELLGILKAQYEAVLAGEGEKARSFTHPYVNTKNKVSWELIGKNWDEPPTPAGIELYKKAFMPFPEDTPIEMQKSGNWVYLHQIGKEQAYSAFFLREDGKWWIVSAGLRNKEPAKDDRFAYLREETYWPDHIDDYFFMPSIRIDVKQSDEPSTNSYFNWRLSLHMTNTSDKTISKTCMSRHFRSVQYVVGKSQSAADPSGGKEFRDIKPGETFYVGDVEIRNPEAGPTKVVFYVGPYLSNPVPTP